jgi:hypothetical protein
LTVIIVNDMLQQSQFKPNDIGMMRRFMNSLGLDSKKSLVSLLEDEIQQGMRSSNSGTQPLLISNIEEGAIKAAKAGASAAKYAVGNVKKAGNGRGGLEKSMVKRTPTTKKAPIVIDDDAEEAEVPVAKPPVKKALLIKTSLKRPIPVEDEEMEEAPPSKKPTTAVKTPAKRGKAVVKKPAPKAIKSEETVVESEEEEASAGEEVEVEATESVDDAGEEEVEVEEPEVAKPTLRLPKASKDT